MVYVGRAALDRKLGAKPARGAKLRREVRTIVAWKPTRLSMELLFGDIAARDDLGVVLRGHLYVEHVLDEMLGLMVAYPTALKGLRLSFQRKVGLARALGLLLRGEEKPLLALNSVRNAYAHDLRAVLSPSQVDVLYRSVQTDWWRRLAGVVKPDSARKGLEYFVMVVVVGMDSKLGRVQSLRGQVLELHKSVLKAYAETLPIAPTS